MSFRKDAESAADKIARTRLLFLERYGGEAGDLRVFASPGRVNLIGEHIDYCGGFVLPAAIDRDSTVVARKRNDRMLRLAATDLPDQVEISLDDLAKGRGLRWGNYQLGVADELQKAGYRLTGADLLFHDTVPLGSGLSSSAAIELATAITLATFGREAASDPSPIDLVQLAVICQKAEHHYVGVNCGIMDQYASAMGRRGQAMMLDCAKLTCEYTPLALGDYTLVIGNTRKKRGLGDSKYNERVRETSAGFRILQQELPGKMHLCDITPAELALVQHKLADPVIRRRVQHVILENERVKQAFVALKANDLRRFAELLDEAQASIRYLYEVTGFELDTLVGEARQAEGCLTARMTGAGFGGCTVNIVRTGYIDSFIRRTGTAYLEKTGLQPEFYVCGIGDGAHEIATAERGQQGVGVS